MKKPDMKALLNQAQASVANTSGLIQQAWFKKLQQETNAKWNVWTNTTAGAVVNPLPDPVPYPQLQLDGAFIAELVQALEKDGKKPCDVVMKIPKCVANLKCVSEAYTVFVAMLRLAGIVVETSDWPAGDNGYEVANKSVFRDAGIQLAKFDKEAQEQRIREAMLGAYTQELYNNPGPGVICNPMT